MRHIKQIKKTLRPLGMTLLAAGAILLAGALLFTGILALLPDRTNETHSYAALLPVSPQEGSEAPTLYPWNLMTVPMEDDATSLSEDELRMLLDPFLTWGELDTWNGGEFLTDEMQTLAGFRNMNIWLRGDPSVLTDKYEWPETEAVISMAQQYRLSLALREGDDSTELCFFSFEPPAHDEYLPSAENAGLTALETFVREREASFQDGNPFVIFFRQLIDLCTALDLDYTAALLLYQTGSLEIACVNHVAYISFKGREGAMTLLCDPIDLLVYGISLQRY